jgi:hypothetical protein
MGDSIHDASEGLGGFGGRGARGGLQGRLNALHACSLDPLLSSRHALLSSIKHASILFRGVTVAHGAASVTVAHGAASVTVAHGAASVTVAHGAASVTVVTTAFWPLLKTALPALCLASPRAPPLPPSHVTEHFDTERSAVEPAVLRAPY